ncbi:MAG: hypothetical protein HYX62_00130 [Gammaproteobacteria bacterium]|nr:hypothetical protein [Gammaproteobacteria bacterium]
MKNINIFSQFNINFIVLVTPFLLTACGGPDEWVCKSSTNANGDAVQYAENINTGEIGAYSNCKE